MTKEFSLGRSTARADFHHGRGVMSRSEAIAYSYRIWSDREKGHWSLDGTTFFDYAKLREEWVNDYCEEVEKLTGKKSEPLA